MGFKFLLKLAIKLYFGLVWVIRLDSYEKMENKGVKPEVHSLVIANFYQKNVHEGKFYSFKYFKHMEYQKLQVYTVLYKIKKWCFKCIIIV